MLKSSQWLQVVPGATRAFIQKEDLSLDVIKQHKIYVHGPEHKANILQSYILSNANKLGQMIVFVRTRHGADQINRVRVQGAASTAMQSSANMRMLIHCPSATSACTVAACCARVLRQLDARSARACKHAAHTTHATSAAHIQTRTGAGDAACGLQLLLAQRRDGQAGT